MSEIDFQDLPPTRQGQPIDQIWIWIGVHADGSEAMISADLPMLLSTGVETMRHMPLLHSTRAGAEAMHGLARRIQREAMHRSDRLIRIELRCYTPRKDPPQ